MFNSEGDRDHLEVQVRQSISILNKCRQHIKSNRPESALAVLRGQSDLNKWLFCTKEISAWTYLTMALAYRALHKWSNVWRSVKLAVDIICDCESDCVDVHLCILKLTSQYYIQSKQ